MSITKLSSKGQITIPKEIRDKEVLLKEVYVAKAEHRL
jgi:AbrB family looped-hinge helix DNA binding protein